jgi:hypothetical protein
MPLEDLVRAAGDDRPDTVARRNTPADPRRGRHLLGGTSSRTLPSRYGARRHADAGGEVVGG